MLRPESDLDTKTLFTNAGASELRNAPEVSVSQTPEFPSLGARLLSDGVCIFTVWAPFAKRVEVVLSRAGSERKCFEMVANGSGYHSAKVEGVSAGCTYMFRPDGGKELPDPASRLQSTTVHGPSQVVSSDFPWTDTAWKGHPLTNYVLYEVHVGTATAEGTFEAIIARLPYLRDLGVTALELMPVAQFPGRRNWGYDGVFPFAVQNSYGGPEGLKRLVNACHREGLAVVLDVVYNHLGPEGNYLGAYGPYFTDRYKTPWGKALNFDGEHSDHVRHYFIQNACQWLKEFHIDALRLDAVHAIRDFSAVPFLQELARAVHKEAAVLGRRFYLFAESDLNDARLIRPEMAGGMGIDAQWNDDFHHILHVLLTGEREGYYADFSSVRQLAKAFNKGYIFTGEHSPFRKRRHGNDPYLVCPSQLVVYAQNHDQIGNRMLGERLSALVRFEQLKLAAAAYVLSPFTPMLFMGEEYGETAPFQYTVDHGDTALLEAVRKGRREEFAAFNWSGDVPDPCVAETFERCRLCWGSESSTEQMHLRNWYRELLRIRRELLFPPGENSREVEAFAHPRQNCLEVYRRTTSGAFLLVLNFASVEQSVIPHKGGEYQVMLDSSTKEWGGSQQLSDIKVRRSENGHKLKAWSMRLLYGS